MLIFIAGFPVITVGVFTLVYAYYYSIKQQAPSTKVIFHVYPITITIACILVILDISYQGWNLQQIGFPILFFDDAFGTLIIALISAFFFKRCPHNKSIPPAFLKEIRFFQKSDFFNTYGATSWASWRASAMCSSKIDLTFSLSGGICFNKRCK